MLMWGDKKNRLVVRYLKTDTSDTSPSHSHYLRFGLLRLRGVNPVLLSYCFSTSMT